MKDPNFEPIWFYLLAVDISWVCDFGYAGGVGAWKNAKHFMNIGDARNAIQNPGWHNDPDGIRRAKPVRISASIKVILAKGA